jgi:predicted phage tail protein
MPRRVYLHGNLREKFGGPFEFHCANTSEAVRLIIANFPDFPAFVANGSYRVIVGSRKKGRHLDETELPMCFPEKDSIHIVPTISGAKGGGGKIIIGVALLAVAAVATGGFALGAGGTALGIGASGWGSVAMIGASMALSGIAMLLTPTPKSPSLTQNERPEDRPSFLLGGAVNLVEQGHPVPICGGRNILGGIVISAGISIEKIPL